MGPFSRPDAAASLIAQPTAPDSDSDGLPQVLALVKSSARRILHLGCGAGALGAALRTRQRAQVVGIEKDHTLTKSARKRLRQVIIGDLEQPDLDLPSGYFDCIICNILPQLKDPWALLRRARGWLAQDGQFVARIPNLRHHHVLSTLLSGGWSNSSAAALEPGNIRFFTRREMEKMFYRAGLRIDQCRALGDPDYDRWQSQGRSPEVRLGRLHIGGLSAEDAEEFHVPRYLVSAVPAELPDHQLTSIVILTHNQLPYTRLCIDSIVERTDPPYELIFVDNASSDGTVGYLRRISSAKVIANSENRGFPAGVNQGIQGAKGQNILLLNNDCVVTTGWLDRLLRALHSDPAVGLVGPRSNCVSGPQQIPVAYSGLPELDGFAWDYSKAHDRHYLEVDRLVGFCLLFKRELLDKIGLFDERFGMGCFEDDDYCRRAMQAGYRLLIADDAFVHHFGSQSFLGNGMDLRELLERNEKVYHDKWQTGEKPASASLAVDGQPAAAPQESGSARREGCRPPASGVAVSLCMIVRDNAETIRPCLESIRPWVDEMIVVDTGSKDNTPELVRRCGARLYHFPWCDDFSAARNESLKHACGEWLFWMDSDDTIDAENGRKLRELALAASDPTILGYVMQVHCPGGGEDGQADVTVVDHVKLVRNRPELRFEGRIHEQILPAIRRAGGEVAFTDIFVVHSGADHSPKGQERKLRRDFRLLELDLQDRPDHPFVLFNLGMTRADAGEHEKAVAALERSIQVADPSESHVRKAYALLVGSHCQLDRYDDAWRACQEGRRHYPQDAELLFREGVLHHHFGRLREAEQAYLAVLAGRDPRHFSSVDRGIQGFKTRHNLALVYEDMGELGRAENQWQQVVREVPAYRLGWRGLGEILLRQGKVESAVQLAERMTADPSLPPSLRTEGLTLQGRAAGSRGQREQAKLLLQQAVDQSPEDIDARHALCRFLFENVDPAEAEGPLRELLRLDPDNPATYHNLGTIHLLREEHAKAVEAFQESLRHRPDSAETHLHLGNALRAVGRMEDARAAWRQAVHLAPGQPAAAEATRQIRDSRDG